uniref:Akirin n=1 Tax=Paramoeba aestuarina TaxID=180227 RepID=A0A7S4NTM2_9EUKA|mmetsp:Transcript_27862/g.43222  ORF Transcript_27862/g.43222 Transcript_27862/m.43222 type:complete len:166 (+) Transcript_27862:118-615(+)|eukprot:CAMPEP_0201511252 /NCGR_PEP_ID=MMETSP0161_2-20130828/3723_1 /ASSEMBLY_ACC=CAM_ASM_000251 /TAXON_ID=180227 /ORGANISM="Neoparamoeba aestuarina, Strain SoJaBio B1-5/56/2" /LENGTH=165 /DNA_ID=CAMNT_0047906663 /DNA_START=116 /DNA_END=613 /DNA_ORIENTATION=-
MAVKLSLKRGRDDDMMGIHTSPGVVGRCSPQLTNNSPLPSSQFDLSGTPTKRARRTSYTSCSSPVLFQNFFPPREIEKDVSEKVTDIVRTKRRQKREPGKQERLFTLDEVKEIVAKAVAEREEEIRLEYNEILSRRLQEQYESFARYNEDCISRRVKESDFSYMS